MEFFTVIGFLVVCAVVIFVPLYLYLFVTGTRKALKYFDQRIRVLESRMVDDVINQFDSTSKT